MEPGPALLASELEDIKFDLPHIGFDLFNSFEK
jgi:hypothetical protein